MTAWTVALALAGSCVEGGFADGQFLCNPAAADECPAGTLCASDGRCRTHELAPPGGAAGMGGAPGGAAGEGGSPGGMGGTGGAACVPIICADVLPACNPVTPDTCEGVLDCSDACPGLSVCGADGVPGVCSCPAVSRSRGATHVEKGLAGTYDNPWQNAYGVTAHDSNKAQTKDPIEDGKSSDYLHLTQFGFAVPAGAEIGGIQAHVWRDMNGSGTIRDKNVWLDHAYGHTASFHSNASWPLSTQQYTYGNPDQKWNGTWSPALINGASFGVTLQAQCTAQSARALIDFVQIEVHFRPPYPNCLSPDG